MCNREYSFATEPPRQTSLINTGMVWGTINNGSTYGQANDLLATMDIPPMPEKMFSKIDHELAEHFISEAERNMRKAAVAEKVYTVAHAQTDNSGTPWITVYVDGGWGKRSYGHNCNASSGSAVIIGQATRKVLIAGVRNKYCSICTKIANNDTDPASHICYKNWNRSSSEMEADIIVEGFNKRIETHRMGLFFYCGWGLKRTCKNFEYGTLWAGN